MVEETKTVQMETDAEAHLQVEPGVVVGGAGGEIFLEIHDPKFFLMSDKDLTIPKIRRKLHVAAGHEYWFNVAAEYLQLLDRPGQRCEQSSQYSFTRCVEVRQSVKRCPTY